MAKEMQDPEGRPFKDAQELLYRIESLWREMVANRASGGQVELVEGDATAELRAGSMVYSSSEEKPLFTITLGVKARRRPVEVEQVEVVVEAD